MCIKKPLLDIEAAQKPTQTNAFDEIISVHVLLHITRLCTTWRPFWILLGLRFRKLRDRRWIITHPNHRVQRNSSTNQLMSITPIHMWGTGKKKKQLSGTSASQRGLYLAARANHALSQIQQGVLWHWFTVESTARTYHPWFGNSKSLVSSTGPVPRLPHSLQQLSRSLGRS